MVVTCGVYLFNRRSKKLLVCHATHASWKQWSIPKGLKEGKETAWDAAVRELLEETGIDLQKVSIRKTHPLPSVKYLKQNKKLESFLVTIDDEDEVELAGTKNSEVDSCRWIPVEQAYTWLHESQQRNLPFIETLVKRLGHHESTI